MPELVFCAPDSRSKPEKVTTLATAGFLRSASVALAVTSRVRVERGGRRQHRHQEDVALVLVRHEAARHALEQRRRSAPSIDGEARQADCTVRFSRKPTPPV